MLGKWLNRRDKKRQDLLKARVEYMKLELLELDLEVQTKEHDGYKEYYKDLIFELEAEIITLD